MSQPPRYSCMNWAHRGVTAPGVHRRRRLEEEAAKTSEAKEEAQASVQKSEDEAKEALAKVRPVTPLCVRAGTRQVPQINVCREQFDGVEFDSHL